MINISDPGHLPVLALFGLVVFVVFPLIVLSSNEAKPIASPTAWLREHYVTAILLIVAALFLAALCFYLVEIALNVPLLVDRLTVEINTTETDRQPENLRNLAYAIATLIAVLAGSATVFFSSLRVWMNERNTRATEQGLITDRINKAVEGLGAEKTVKRQRHDQDGNPTYEKDAKGSSDYSKPVLVETSEPNLEVRIGSIFALERIARENLEFHLQVMEILCAYVQLNAPSEDYQSGDRRLRANRPNDDIRASLKVLGRRSQKGRILEHNAGSRLDLRFCDLSRIDFREQDFSAANFQHSIFLDAHFRDTILRGADLSFAQKLPATFVRCDLTGSKFNKAEFWGNQTDAFSGHWGSNTIVGASFAGADIRAIRRLPKPEKLSGTFGTIDTKLPSSHNSEATAMLWESLNDQNSNETRAATKRKLRKMGLENWSCYGSADIAAADHYNALMIQLDLCDFPFHGRRK
jgi:uncharacterized protein YjbI with pentapeptide repeats